MVTLPVEPAQKPAAAAKSATKATPRAKAPKGAQSALEAFEAAFEKDFGTSHMTRGADVPYGVDVIPTGSLTLDYRLGCGGFPIGRITELWGMPGTCKTTQTMLAIAAAQAKFPDQYAAFIDVEGTFDRKWAELHGVDMNRLRLFEKIKTAEEVSDRVLRISESELFSICVLDSIGAMIPREEYEKLAEQATVGTKAKIVTRMVKRLAHTVRISDQAMVFINQVRAIVGPTGGTTTDGGFGLKHVSSVQAKYAETGTRRVINVDGKEVVVGKEINVKTVKNKLAPPNQNARFLMRQMATDRHGPVGLDVVGEALDIGKLTGVIARSGSWLTLPSGEKFGSADKTMEHLVAHPEEVEAIRTAALATVADTLTADLPEAEDFDEDRAAMESVGNGPAPVDLDELAASDG